MKWTDSQANQVRDLLVAFNGPVEVCAVMGVEPSMLDDLCLGTFGHDFAQTQASFAAQGRAALRRLIYDRAMEGDSKCIDMLARERLGLGPVEQRRANIAHEAELIEMEAMDDDALAGLIPAAEQAGG